MSARCVLGPGPGAGDAEKMRWARSLCWLSGEKVDGQIGQYTDQSQGQISDSGWSGQ